MFVFKVFIYWYCLINLYFINGFLRYILNIKLLDCISKFSVNLFVNRIVFNCLNLKDYVFE